MHTACKRLFATLPLAARVGTKTLVLHGGLFRKPNRTRAAKQKRRRLDAFEPGTLDDLARAPSKGGLDPNGLGFSRLATDVLWSDPVAEPGFQLNTSRGIGMVFGPDVTARFLEENGLALVLRSHEGPDAREGREDLGPMTGGWTLDHDTPHGRLMTVFSAPDYPQFVPESQQRYNNLAAVAVLDPATDYASPSFRQLEAVRPRFEAQPYYDLGVPDSDEELEPVPSEASGMTDVRAAREEEDADGEVSQPKSLSPISSTSEVSASLALPAPASPEESCRPRRSRRTDERAD